MTAKSSYIVSVAIHVCVFLALVIAPERDYSLDAGEFFAIQIPQLRPPMPEKPPLEEPKPEEKPEPKKPKPEEPEEDAISPMEEDLKTPTPKATPTRKPTQTPKPTPTRKPTEKPKATSTPTSKPKPTPTEKAKPTAKPSPTPKPKATPTPKLQPTPTPEEYAFPVADLPNIPLPTIPPGVTPQPVALPTQLPSVYTFGNEEKAGAVTGGNSASGATSGYSFSIEGLPGGAASGYGNKLHAILQGNWRTPTVRAPESRKYTTVVKFSIYPNGTISDVSLVVTSGWPIMDQSVTDLLKRISPLKELPPGFSSGVIKVTVPFSYASK